MFSGQQQDSGRWATHGELRAGGWLHPSGWPLGPLNRVGPITYIPPLVQRENIMALAPPGSGKTRGILVPALLSETRQPPAFRRSLIVVDPEGELYRLTGRQLARTHKIVVWNPARPQMCNAAFDPLAYIRAWDKPGYVGDCELAAMVWLSATADTAEGGGRRSVDPYWEKQPANALKGLFLAWGGIQPLSITKAATALGEKDTAALLADLTESNIDAARARGAVISDLLKNERAGGNVFSDLRERFMVLGNPTVAGTMQGKSVDFSAMMREPTAIFIQVSTAALYLQPLLSVFVATAVGELLKVADGQPLPREVRFVIDELGNLGRIHDLAGSLATLRKFHIGFLMATQTTARLADRYGQQLAESIMGTCGTVLALGGLSFDDASWASRQLGTRVTTGYKASFSPGMSSGGGANSLFGFPVLPVPRLGLHVNQQKDTAPLRTADAIRAMNKALVVLPTRLRPFETGLEIYTGG